MPNSHPEICASPNSLLTFCPHDISLNFSDSIHQDIWAIVEKNIQREKPKRHRQERKKKSKVPVMKKNY
jgi:methionine-rich copper-binding protein CopC